MNEELKIQLQNFANKYEVASFCNEDPSQFLRWYPLSRQSDVECAAFIAAMLSFGNRKQFIPKISQILTLADESGGISQWILSGAKNFPTGEKKFYRFYSYDEMHIFFDEIAEILQKKGSLGQFFGEIWQEVGRCGQSGKSNCPLEGVAEDAKRLQPGEDFPLLDSIIANYFPKSAIVPKGKNSANKRIHMFLRWMCRQNSPVDLGIWNWYPARLLIIPLDVHVMEESIKLGLLRENSTASRKTALLLTEQLEQAFPEDPVRGDFALFGFGVSK